MTLDHRDTHKGRAHSSQWEFEKKDNTYTVETFAIFYMWRVVYTSNFRR